MRRRSVNPLRRVISAPYHFCAARSMLFHRLFIESVRPFAYNNHRVFPGRFKFMTDYAAAFQEILARYASALEALDARSRPGDGQ